MLGSVLRNGCWGGRLATLTSNYEPICEGKIPREIGGISPILSTHSYVTLGAWSNEKLQGKWFNTIYNYHQEKQLWIVGVASVHVRFRVLPSGGRHLNQYSIRANWVCLENGGPKACCGQLGSARCARNPTNTASFFT